MQLVNKDKDFHMHTINFSDGLHTIEELVQYAGRIGLKEILITDHSQATITTENLNPVNRGAIKRWRNVHNDVKVRFGIEADLLNRKGDICDDILGRKGEFLVLSAHARAYQDDKATITEAYINAIERFHDSIVVLGHIDAYYMGEHVDVKRVVETANKYGLIVELNAKNLVDGRNLPEKTKIMLDTANNVMVNSDAHTLADFDTREKAFAYLKEHGYINDEENL